MVDLEKYKNDGWGLSKKEFELLVIELNIMTTPKVNVVEFGSGRSTEFLVDFMEERKYPLEIYSFDDSKEYAYNGIHENLNLYITSLVDTDDATFEDMFKNKKYERLRMQDKLTPVHTRQKNTFYKIEDGMLPDEIHLLIVDGPHGNGRSLAYLHCFDKLVNGAIVLIDDASHYPFYDHLKMLRECEIIYEQHIKEDKWENGGDFTIIRIIKK